MPTPKKVIQYKVEGKGGPDPDNLRIDMKGKITSKWNQAVGHLVLDHIHQQKRKAGEAWNSLPERSDKYFLEIVTDHIERGRTVWRDAQPKVKDDGTVEDPAEIEKRMNEDKERKGMLARAATRRVSVSSIPFEYCSQDQD